MDVSRLGIVVESKGIDEARKALDGGNGRGGLLGAAEKVDKVVVKLTDSMSKLLNANTSGTATAWNQSLGQLSGTLSALNSSIMATTKALREMSPAMQGAADVTERASRANRDKSSTGNVVTNTLKAMTTAALAYMSVNVATSVVKQADSWQMMQARLQNATGSLNNALVAQDQMYTLAQRLRVPLEDSVKLYTRLAPAIQKAGKSSEYAKDMVEGISTALQLGGANGAEASSVMLQLSQSFSSGVLNGAEFNAVSENGSVLMRALEKSTGKATYELKKMGSEGKLTMEMVGKAIQENLPEWRKSFDLLPMTFEGAMTRLKNAWTRGVGELGQSTGFNQQLSQALLSVEKLIPMVLRGLGEAFSAVMTWIEKNRDKLVEVGQNVGLVLSQVWELARAFGQVAGDVSMLGEKTSAWAVALKGTAYVVAALADGFTVVSSMILLMGSALGKLIILPMQGWSMILEEIIRAWAGLLEMTTAGLRAIGKNDSADRLQGFADSAKNAANAISNTNADIDGFLKGGAKLAIGWLDNISRGEGALGKLWNRADSVQKKITTVAGLRGLENGISGNSMLMDPEAWNANKNPKVREDEKAKSKAATATRHYEDAITALNAKLQDQLILQQNLEKSGLAYDKVGPAMKEYVKLEAELVALSDKNASQKELDRAMDLRDRAMKIANLETVNERTLEGLKAEQAVQDKQKTTVENLQDQTSEIERQVASYGLAKGAVEALALAEARRRASEYAATSDSQQGANYEKVLASLNAEVTARERIAAAKERLGVLETDKEFDKLFDARRAERFGNVLAEGFGKAGKAMGLLANAADKYLARQAKISQGRTILDKMDKNSVDYAKRSTKLAEEEAEARIASYADMAGAAKGFFEEGSKGYKAMQAAEMTFRAFQMAMQVKSFLQEIGFITATTSAAVTGDAVKASSAATSASVQAAASAVAGTAAAAAGVANQAGGDPYTAFPRMAAMAALMAALGFAVLGGGAGGVDISKQRQAAQGTGTVFGDEKAKSESIAKALEIVSKNSDIALRYSSGMLSSLQNIEYSLTGATSGVIRTGSSVTGKGYENSSSMFGGAGGLVGATLLTGVVAPIAAIASKLPLIGGLVSKLVTSLFGSKSTLKDSGLMGNSQSVANILQSGFNVQAYQDVQTQKKLFGITYSNKTSTNTSPVDPAISREFGNIVSGMVESLANAAGALGESGDLVRQKLAAVNIDIGKISLKDLSSEEIQKQLEAVFSAIGDKLAVVALPMVTAFQKSGEGLLETAVRVATGVESATYELEKLGITAVAFQNLTNKSGDVGAEIVRQSILAQEAGAGISEIIRTLSGDAGTIADTYKSLSSVRDSLKSLGLADDVTRELIRAAGGLDALNDAISSYTDNFFTDAEKTAMKSSALSKEFAKLGLAMPVSKDAFRSLVESLSASGASGLELAMKVLSLADAFADLNSTTDSLVASARDDLSSAYERESQALTDVRDKFQDFADSLKEFKTSLLTGDLSTLNVADKYGVEKAKFEETLAKAKGGDANAIGSFQEVATSFLTASRAMNASSAIYTADFQRVLAETDAIQGLAQGKASVAQQQLDALTSQVQGLITLNTSVLTVAQAIQNLTVLLTGATPSVTMPVGPTMGIPTPPPMAQATSVQTDMATQNAALVASVQALTMEVATLRQEQNAQTSAMIAANYDANMANASAVVEGTNDAVSSSNYHGRVETQLA
jgi:tape measure domain-containing protein